MNTSGAITWPEGVSRSAVMFQAHDVAMLELEISRLRAA